MREVKIGDKTIEIRPLTKKEIKKLKKLGYTYLGCNPDLKNLEGVIDDAFGLVFDKNTLDYIENRPMKDSRTVWQQLLKETYGDKDEEKNSQSTGDGTTTASA